MKRREFFNFVGVGLMATSLPVALAACSPAETPADESEAPEETEASPGADVSSSSDTSDGFAEIGTTAELDSAGFLANKSFMGEQVVVVRDPADATAVVALNSICTHQGCTVDWKESEFVCPCHQSKFSADGAVLSGPADKPLPTYEAKVEGDSVLVKVV